MDFPVGSQEFGEPDEVHPFLRGVSSTVGPVLRAGCSEGHPG